MSIIIHQKDLQFYEFYEHYYELYSGLSKQKTEPVCIDENVSMKTPDLSMEHLKM